MPFDPLTFTVLATSPFAPQDSSLPGLLILVAVFLLMAVRRLYAGLNGIAYSSVRVLRVPVLYFLFTLFAVFAFGSISIYLVSTLAFIPLAAILGYMYATRCSFFYREGRVFYTRHMFVLVFWLISFIARLILEFLLPFNLYVDVALSAVLSFTTGLIIGEALNIRKKYREFVGANPLTS